MGRRRTGIIYAFDQSTFDEADQALLEEIAPFIDYVKVGLEAMTAEDPDDGKTIARKVREFTTEVLDKNVMWDMKLHDIGATVAKAVENIRHNGSGMFTLHASCSMNALRRAAEITRTMDEVSLCHPLAVTVLTDLDDAECLSRFGTEPNEAVFRFAQTALECGITGLVCSPRELPYLDKKDILGNLLSVIPGIRPTWAATDDQQRVTTPAEAARAGADYIVVGRPIRKPPPSVGTPVRAARLIRTEMDTA